WTEVDSLNDGSKNYPRYDATAFSFDSVGYVLTGTDGFNYFGDVWRFSPATGQWTKELGFPGSPSSGGSTFVYQGQGFILCGHTPDTRWASANLAYDFWRFNPNSVNADITWIRLRN